jgi:biotin operon repressor
MDMPSMDEYAQLKEARQLLDSDSVSRRTLELLRRQQGAAGWAIAKALDMDPETISKALRELRSKGLIDIDSVSGSGLDGFYFLTRLAYMLVASAV